MESGMNSLNKIREIQNRALALKKLSKEVYDDTLSTIQDLRVTNEQNSSSKIVILQKKSTISSLEVSNHSLDKRLMNLEAILSDKKQNLMDQEQLLVEERQSILQARSTFCDRVYNLEKKIREPKPSISRKHAEDVDNLKQQIQNCEKELQVLHSSILEKESVHNNFHINSSLRKQEVQHHQKLLENKKEILKNLIQEVKNLKFNIRKSELSRTIETLYHKNSYNDFPVRKHCDVEISNYFDDSVISNDFTKSETLNKLRHFCASKTADTSQHNKVSTMNQNFTENSVKRCKISEEVLPSAQKTNVVNSASTSNLSEMKESHEIIEDKRKFIPKKPLFSRK